jgi:hypothetical protein
MKIGNTLLETADRPVSVFAIVLVVLIAGVLAPTIDDAIPVLSKAEASGAVFIGDRDIGWKLEVCRWRGGPQWEGASFVVNPRDGSPSYTLFNVMDVDAGVEVGSGSLNFKMGECRSLRYSAHLPDRVVEGDVISGTAQYSNLLWEITDLYGTVEVPEFPKLLEFQQRIIQRELQSQGQGLEEFKK